MSNLFQIKELKNLLNGLLFKEIWVIKIMYKLFQK